jgi:hypothetical protein
MDQKWTRNGSEMGHSAHEVPKVDLEWIWSITGEECLFDGSLGDRFLM